MIIVNREKTRKGHPWSYAHQQGPQALAQATMSQISQRKGENQS